VPVKPPEPALPSAGVIVTPMGSEPAAVGAKVETASKLQLAPLERV